MALCPSCNRPVAMARPRCLYCGAALPREAVEEAAQGAAAAAGPGSGPLSAPFPDETAPAITRALLILEILQQVRRRERVKPVLLLEAPSRRAGLVLARRQIAGGPRACRRRDEDELRTGFRRVPVPESIVGEKRRANRGTKRERRGVVRHEPLGAGVIADREAYEFPATHTSRVQQNDREAIDLGAQR